MPRKPTPTGRPKMLTDPVSTKVILERKHLEWLDHRFSPNNRSAALRTLIEVAMEKEKK